ncbi:MAG: hypothetical protein EOP52_00370 [Sphingobacteriales bacterium]|nr:MAG: hypothetical protein EOP52_00370 [Sphingobacteriales bacterium]
MKPVLRSPVFRKCFVRMLLLLLGSTGSSRAQDLSQIGQAKPFAISGSIGVEGTVNGQSGASPVPPLNSYGLNANVNMSVYGWNVPLSVAYYNRNLSYSQPFQRYGLSPTYKWITLHAGWRSVAFSPLVFSGVNFLGGGIELNPGKFRFGVVYGQFNKALAEDTSRNRLSDFGTYSYPAYRRTGYGVKLGFGTQKSFVDLVFFRATDDTNSIARPVLDRRIRPQQNTAGSLIYQQTMGRHLVFRLNTAVSVYNYDMQADTIPGSLIGNGSGFKEVQPVLLSTQVGYAGDASLAYKSRQIDVRATVRQLSPFYQSMGIYSRLQDLREIWIEGAYRSKNNKFFGNASFNTDHNNIAQTKIATTTRYGVLLNGNYEVNTKLGFNAGYTYNGYTQVKQFSGLPDTLLSTNSLHNLNAGAHYTTINAYATNNVLVSGGYQTGAASGLNLDANSYQNYFLTLNEAYMVLQSKLGINGGLNFFGTSGYGTSAYSLGGNAGVSKAFFKDRLTAGVNGGYFRNFSPSGNSSSATAAAQLGYRGGRHHSVTLGGNYTFNHSDYADYSVYRLQSAYLYTF